MSMSRPRPRPLTKIGIAIRLLIEGPITASELIQRSGYLHRSEWSRVRLAIEDAGFDVRSTGRDTGADGRCLPGLFWIELPKREAS